MLCVAAFQTPHGVEKLADVSEFLWHPLASRPSVQNLPPMQSGYASVDFKRRWYHRLVANCSFVTCDGAAIQCGMHWQKTAVLTSFHGDFRLLPKNSYSNPDRCVHWMFDVVSLSWHVLAISKWWTFDGMWLLWKLWKLQGSSSVIQLATCPQAQRSALRFRKCSTCTEFARRTHVHPSQFLTVCDAN